MSTEALQASGDTRFYLDVPNIFHPLPLLGGEEELAAMADELMPDAGDEMRRVWMDLSRTLVGALSQADTRYAGLCCERDSDTGVSPAALVVATPQLSFGDPRVAAAGIVQVVGSTPGADARVLNLPSGPSAVVAKERRLRLPNSAEAGGGERALPVREAQMYIPHKPWQRMVLISLSTPAIADWDVYARIFVRIGRSVRFGTGMPGA
ncbi:MAG: hypothetical protein GEV03_18950 [Streptosporangiales bacterium]|nr:hypothetical protein [Streptosporangiales bacterium]